MFFARRVMDFLFSLELSEKYRMILAIAIMILGIQIGNYTWIPMNIDIAFTATGLMYAGYFLRKRNVLKQDDSPHKNIIPGLFCFLVQLPPVS